MARRKKRLSQKLHDYFLPHARNRYRPGVFALGSVTALLVVLLGIFGMYFGDVKIASKSGFFASVLPAALTAYTNADRAAASLHGLDEDPLLDKAAQLKADDMAAKGYFAHVSPDGTTPWHWFDAVGYQYSYAGENLAVDFVDSKDVEDAWMQSPAHHANIVKPAYTKIGIGVAEGMYEGHTTTFVVEFFATPVSAAEAPVSTSVSDAPAPADAKVLGAALSPAPALAQPVMVGFLARAVAAPTHTLIYLLLLALTFFGALFGFALARHAHLRIRSIEMIEGGVVLTGALAACLIYVASTPAVVVPQDSHAASIVQSR